MVIMLGASASAGPGEGDSGTMVVIDANDDMDLMVVDARESNEDASHVPVEINLAVPQDVGFDSATITVYLTKDRGPDAVSYEETTLIIRSALANRTLIVEVPSPGAGSGYYVHARGKIDLTDGGELELVSSLDHSISFGVPRVCTDIVDMGADVCPIKFGKKSSKLSTAALDVVSNLGDAISELCESDSLRRVAILGWASPRNSVNPTNEELARARAASVIAELQKHVPETCRARLHNDSKVGREAVTLQFGSGSDDDEERNQCAQVIVTRHSCRAP